MMTAMMDTISHYAPDDDDQPFWDDDWKPNFVHGDEIDFYDVVILAVSNSYFKKKCLAITKLTARH